MSQRPLLALAIAFLVACGPSGPDPKEVEAQKEAAEKKKADEDALAKRKADREAKEKAAKDAEEAEKAAIDALAVLPETLPKKLDKACDERAKAEDEFMQKHYEGEALDKWNAAKGTQLGMAKQMCMKGKIEVAACQVNALNQAPSELRKKLPDLLKACMEKFGGDAPAGE
ncbi:MAG: hypothetical protein H6710_20025 [Myxococcales bacterium]|nr:hypothetical protein [Myxococcales bacterium]MCB9706198.1 hypothetical protein [Myxococcales bacterium]